MQLRNENKLDEICLIMDYIIHLPDGDPFSELKLKLFADDQLTQAHPNGAIQAQDRTR